jgi:tetratricopeptide (TPR) repeat protein
MAKIVKRYFTPILVALFFLITLGAFFLPKNDFQSEKEQLVKSPADTQTQLKLAEELLANHQFEEAEKVLQLAGLKETPPEKLTELWLKKFSNNPRDIPRLISFWEKFLEQRPDYRDGWLQLALLNFKIYENEKAQKALEKALFLDPNHEPAKILKEIILGV